VTTIILDTGPLVALLNRRERYHSWVSEILDTVEPPVFTCDPVLSEACFLLQDVKGGQDAVLALISRGIVRSDFRVTAEIEAIRAMMKKFADVPMSLADACLVRMTEIEAQGIVLTLDSDFRIYRRNRRQTIPTITPSKP
jgi:uncharacterized protein